MSIVTKKGDRGESGLFTGERALKSEAIFEALGNLDELNSLLGWCRCAAEGNLVELLERLQDDTYRLMSLVGFKGKCPPRIEAPGEEDVAFLEGQVAEFERKVGDLRKFVRPGSSELAARLHVARSVCRRAERSLVRMGALEKSVLAYVNRLSDLLFIAACAQEQELNFE